jgi:hypothetical protein
MEGHALSWPQIKVVNNEGENFLAYRRRRSASPNKIE